MVRHTRSVIFGAVLLLVASATANAAIIGTLTFRDPTGTVNSNEAIDVWVTLTLDSGATLEADLLLVATGVRANTDYLDGPGAAVARDKGILVDEAMRTSVDNVWAAGDCAQAKGFFSEGKVMNAILPDAAEQGRIAGRAVIAF